MASQFTGSFDILGSINTIAVEGAPPSTLGSSELSGSLGVTGSLDLAYLSGSTTTEPGAWSTGGSLIIARFSLAGAGIQNAGLAFGGYSNPTYVALSCTEEYDGTSWTAGGALITARRGLGGAGTQNAGLAFGGYAPPSILADTEEYNGTSWSAGGALITARRSLGGAGTQNSALAFGGRAPSQLACTEEYTATSTTTYTTVPTINYDATNGALVLSQVLATSYADDTAAAAGGVPVGGLYRNVGSIKIRLT